MSCCWRHKGDQERSIGIKPYKDRSCTDVLSFLLFLAFWGGTVYIAVVAISDGGNPNRIIRGVDMYGRICGKDQGVTDKPYAAWPYPPEIDFQICLASCSETTTDSNMAVPLASTAFLYYCIPSATDFSSDFSSATEKLSRALGDLYTAWPVLAGSCGIALVLSFAYILVCKRFAGALVWSLIFTMLLGGAFFGWSFLKSAKDADGGYDSTRAQAMYGVGGTLVGLSVVFAVVVIAMRQRINIAVEVVKESSRALMDVPSLTVFPLVPFLCAGAYFTGWVILALYIYTVATKSTRATPSTVTTGTSNPSTSIYYARDTTMNDFIIGHFFGLLWNVQFLIYFAYLVMAGAVADWYFHAHGDDARALEAKSPHPRNQVVPVTGEAWGEPNVTKGEKVTGPSKSVHAELLAPSPLWRSLKRVLRFHLGTVALGALIIAIVNFLRATIAYLEATSKNRKNRLQRAVFCLLQCCLKCVHCCLDKLSKNAFIWTAIWGDSFVPAACGSFKLLWANLARVAAINMVGTYLLFLGKLMVASLTTGICALIFLQVNEYKENLSSPLLPCLVIFIIAYAMGSFFLNVYETTIDTIFLCFLVDAEYNKSTPMYASKGLQELVDKHADASQKAAAEQQVAFVDRVEGPVQGQLNT